MLESPDTEEVDLMTHSRPTRLSRTPAQAAGTTSLEQVAVLGNHLPRQCGIATFTTDLSDALVEEFSALQCFVLAMNDAGHRYAYPERVRFELAATDALSYRRAADFLNGSAADLVSVQHEYGIFGGEAGSHLLSMLRELRKPIVTTLHTILAEPDAAQRVVMDEITRLSERLVVMSASGAALLHEVHGVSTARIDVIPHGIPDLPGSERSKRRLGMKGKSVLLTFGLMSPDKGIEHVIDALPAIVARHPEALYVVVGATHPHVKERHGEAYRVGLARRARELGVDAHVTFHNRFMSQDELTEFLSAADLYITPYLNPEQSTSGTLAYAVGSGKATVSTPYAYARELLADGRGVLVPWPRDDAGGIARAITGLLDDDVGRAALRERAAAYGHDMRWPAVARAYVRSFERARSTYAGRQRPGLRAKTLAQRPLALPEIHLAHLGALSDHTGILQHATFTVPRLEDGYCLDDNARALLLTSQLEGAPTELVTTARALAPRYLAFVNHAFDTHTGRFKNFMSYSRQWLDAPGSEDCHGRALWALGSVVGRGEDVGRCSLARDLFDRALRSVRGFTSPRAWAYTLLGIDAHTRGGQPAETLRDARRDLARRLFELHRRTSSSGWPWFEERVTYCNARLPQALLLSGARMQDDEMVAVGIASLRWLSTVQRPRAGGEHFAPVGSNGFYDKHGDMAAFDQQPVEAAAMVSACLTAACVTGETGWSLEARRAFQWFLGHNQLGQSLYDPATGGCRDGLHADRLNENQGAESTLSFLAALVEMRSASPQLEVNESLHA